MEKISEEYPSAIVRENGLSALLSMLDFFPTSVQRIALQAAANCCRNFSADNFNLVSPVFPILRNMLGSFDQRLVEYSSLCVIRLIESFQRSAPDNLVALLDAEFIQAIGALLLPASGSPLVSNGTYTLFLSALASASKASAKTTLALLEADLLRILYQLLTGVLPPSADTQHSDIPGSDPVLTEMAVMENMAHRSKEQIEEALALVNELMPPLPRGKFPPSQYQTIIHG
jgi:E3 ubiquitin-protein ligase TRIP12